MRADARFRLDVAEFEQALTAADAAAQQGDPFLAHPAREVDSDWMTQGAADGGERDSGVPAGRFDDQPTRPQRTAQVAPPHDLEGHPILHAPGHVQVFRLGVDPAFPSTKSEVNRQQRRVPDEGLEAPGGVGAVEWVHGLIRRVPAKVPPPRVKRP